MQFEARYAEGIADGSISLTFRRWKRSQAVPGHRYRTSAGRIEVESVDIVEPQAITDADAVRSGYPSADALRADLRGGDELAVYQVRFRPADGPDPRDELAAATTLDDVEVADLDRSLARLDRASSSGPWTAVTLDLIAARPATLAAELAASLGRETVPFKLDVRKLKALGLTQSLERGYRLSPRGEAYRRHPARVPDDG